MTRQGRRVTGGQAEPGSWVGKLSLDQHKDLFVEGHLEVCRSGHVAHLPPVALWFLGNKGPYMALWAIGF